MPAIEGERNAGRSGPARDFSLDLSPARPAAPRPAPLPDTSRTPSAARDTANRFAGTNLTKLTPFAMPAPAPKLTSMASEPVETYNGYMQAPRSAAVSDYPAKLSGRPSVYDNAADDRNQTPPKEKTRRSYQMSWEEYNALSAEQRAAVDFNTMLVQAREKDLNTGYVKVDPAERTKYDKAVERMFGKDGGSETFAPETVAVLQKIDFKDTTEDLDNFLGLKSAISEKELQGFTTEVEKMKLEIPEPLTAVTPTDTVQITAAPTTEQAVAADTVAMHESMVKANAVLQTFKAAAAADRSALAVQLGGLPNEPRIGAGYGQPEMVDGQPVPDINTFIQGVYIGLANSKQDPSEVWAKVDQTMAGHPEEKKALMQYLDARSREALDTGVPLIDSEFARQPDEFRKMLGLDQVGD